MGERMGELTKQDAMTIQEVADVLGASYDTIQAKAKDLGFTKNGVKTLLTAEQVQAIKDNYIPHTFGVMSKVQNALTDIDAMRMTKQLLEYYGGRLSQLEQENKTQQAKLIEQQPKVDYYDAIISSGDAIDMGAVAKTLAIKGLGRNNLFEFLREQAILNKDNIPYQKYIDAGYFKTVVCKYTVGDETRIAIKTVVYQKGVEFIKALVQQSKITQGAKNE